MRVFISGIAGFLGSHLADALLKEGNQVVGADNLLGGYSSNVSNDCEFLVVDCTNLEQMKLMLRGVDVVVHCAASPYEGLSVFSPYIVNQNTYMTTIALLSASVHNKVKRFVFTSSMARYGKQSAPFMESYPISPEDPYGIAKVASEMAVKNICETHGIEWTIAVPHNIIGPRQKYDDPYRNVASIFINLMLQGRQPFIYGSGEQKRCFSFVNDCISCLSKMTTEKEVVGEVINIGPDEETVTINELAETISGLLNFDLKPTYLPSRPKEVFLASCSSNKARELLGYKTTYSLKQGLQEMINWIRQSGPKPFEYHLPIEFETDKIPKTWKEKLM